MIIVFYKKTGNKKYITLRKFKTYKSAYYYTANILWRENNNLNWSYSIKYLCNGYSKKKIFIYGSNYVRRNGFCYKIAYI